MRMTMVRLVVRLWRERRRGTGRQGFCRRSRKERGEEVGEL